MYTAYRAAIPPALDGTLSGVWETAPRTPAFVDMATGKPAPLETTAAVLWDETHLYVAFWVEEPYPVATQTERDSLIFRENDVEVFIDGGDCYYEFEVSARNTVYEVFFIWRDVFGKGGRFDLPEFDLYRRDAYSFGGNFDRTNSHFWKGTHPRGTRWAFLDWDFPGMRSAVHVVGTLNDPATRSQGWRAEIAFPWQGMTLLANGRLLPPRDGDLWKLFLGRFQILGIGGREEQAAWCVTPHGVYDTHLPEKFTSVVFADRPPEIR